MDSYDVANKILELYRQNVNKSSGEMQKKNLEIPIKTVSRKDGIVRNIHNVIVWNFEFKNNIIIIETD